jgi:hypothetical protein
MASFPVLFRNVIFLAADPFAKVRERLKMKNPLTKTVIIRPHFNNVNAKGDSSIIIQIEITHSIGTSIINPVNYRKRIEINRDKQTLI